MRLLIDTNLLVAAALFPNGVSAKAYNKAMSFSEYSVFICDYSIEETRKVYRNKFPDKIDIIELFLNRMQKAAKIIETPPESEKIPEEELIRDIKDRPILRAAVKFQIDIIITGDKDFLESGIKSPKMLSPVDFFNS